MASDGAAGSGTACRPRLRARPRGRRRRPAGRRCRTASQLGAQAGGAGRRRRRQSPRCAQQQGGGGFWRRPRRERERRQQRCVRQPGSGGDAGIRRAEAGGQRGDGALGVQTGQDERAGGFPAPARIFTVTSVITARGCHGCRPAACTGRGRVTFFSTRPPEWIGSPAPLTARMPRTWSRVAPQAMRRGPEDAGGDDSANSLGAPGVWGRVFADPSVPPSSAVRSGGSAHQVLAAGGKGRLDLGQRRAGAGGEDQFLGGIERDAARAAGGADAAAGLHRADACRALSRCRRPAAARRLRWRRRWRRYFSSSSVCRRGFGRGSREVSSWRVARCGAGWSRGSAQRKHLCGVGVAASRGRRRT